MTCYIYLITCERHLGDSKKVMCQLLGKLYLPDAVDDDKIKTLKLLVYNVQSVRVQESPVSGIMIDPWLKRRPLRDAAAKNSFARFDNTITKKYEKQLDDFSEEEYRKLEYLNEMFEFLDDIIPEEEEEIVLPTKGRKR